MEQSNTINYFLELIECPAFCVRDGIVVQSNHAAVQRQILVGTQINEYLQSDTQLYKDFSGGTLDLTLFILGKAHQASVERIDTLDVFLLKTESVTSALKALSLAAQQLRAPLSGIMAMVEYQLSNKSLTDDPEMHAQLTQVNRGLYQLQRTVCAMADASQYQQLENIRKELVDIGSVFYEALEKANTLLATSNIHVNFIGLRENIFCDADPLWIERAVYNLLSNAAKFSTKPCTIEAKLTRSGNMLHFSVQDNGDYIPENVRSSIFSRFLRTPGLENGSYGIGLGMTLVRSIAAAHGGTVFIDKPSEKGNRVTLTLSITQSSRDNVRSPILRVGDYAGGRDRALLELSDVLPSELFDTTNR